MPANIQDKILIADPKTLEERRKAAREFAEQFKLSVPILVDTLDDRASLAYSAWPDRIYVIDAEGKIAYKGGVGPAGFKVAEVPPVLDRLLAAPPADARPTPPPPDAVPSTPLQRLRTMLGRFGLEPRETDAVIQAAEKKMLAYNEVTRARRMLLAGARQGDAAPALAELRAAEQAYRRVVEQADGELDAAIGYRRNPRLSAILTGLGLIGETVAPPLSGLNMPAGAAGPRPGARRGSQGNEP